LFAFNIVYADLQKCFKESVPPKEEVLEMFGRHKVNSFNIMDAIANEAIAMSLYIDASAIDHSCSPNAAISFSGKTLFVRSITEDPNLSFEDVRIAYTDTMADTATRRVKLREKYYFECGCVACETDPSGLDLLKQSAMRCPRCQSAVHAAKEDADLKCLKCSESLDAKAFKALKAKVVADVIDNEKGYPRSVLDKVTVRYADDMLKAKFHPYDKVYLSVLEKAYHVHLANAEWRSVIEVLGEIVVAYKGLYPKYNYNTAMMLRNAGVQALVLNLLQEAKAFLQEARKIVTVTHGQDHPIVLNIVQVLSMVRAK
jgi:SET and MYND domain-containing protein